MQVIPRLPPLGAAWHQTREVFATFKSGEWPENLTDKTNYLLLAQAIRQATPDGGTVAVSGFMYTLYPLTGLLPPLPQLNQLSEGFMTRKLFGSRFRDALLRCPPDVLMISTRTNLPGNWSSELLASVQETGIYEKITEIFPVNDRAYGNFGGIIFRAKKRFSCKPLAE